MAAATAGFETAEETVAQWEARLEKEADEKAQSRAQSEVSVGDVRSRAGSRPETADEWEARLMKEAEDRDSGNVTQTRLSVTEHEDDMMQIDMVDIDIDPYLDNQDLMKQMADFKNYANDAELM